MLKLSLCYYIDAFIVVKETITVGVGATTGETKTGKTNKHLIFINCTPFTDCIGKINNTQNK